MIASALYVVTETEIANAQDVSRVWTSKSVYRVGETVIVYYSIAAVFYSPIQLYLSFEGPYSFDVSLGEALPGTYEYVAGTAEPRDVGMWHVILNCGPLAFCPEVAAETYFEVIHGGPADLVVMSVWANPRNPHQEDMVSFGAEIANIGGTDAYGFGVEVYLDGNLWDTMTASVPAGSSATLRSGREYQAEDGPHDVRWVVNPDRSVQESDYGNNEGSATFFVSPRTVTETVTVTKTSTRTQTQRTTTTIVVTRTTTKILTTDTTVQRTVTANPRMTTMTLTGLATSTVYSPTVTVTVTAAQTMPNPIVWLALGTLGMIGVIFRPATGFMALLRFGDLFTWLAKRHVRRGLLTICLIGVIVLSISLQATEQAFGSTVTTTRTVTRTEWTTITQSVTSTRYSTSMATDTSTFKRTQTGFTTVTPTKTATVDRRSTTTVYSVTTTTSIQPPSGGPGISVSIELDDTFGDSYFIGMVDVRSSDRKYGCGYSWILGDWSHTERSITVPEDCIRMPSGSIPKVPTDPQSQPIAVEVQVTSEENVLRHLDKEFSLDLSNFRGQVLTIWLGKTDDRVSITEVEPAITPVSAQDLEIIDVKMHESLWNVVPFLSRTYYYTVTIRNRSPSYSIALMGIGIDLPSGYNWKLADLKIKEQPEHEGEIVKAWETLGAISTVQDLAEAYRLAGVDGIVYNVLTNAVQDFTHTSDYEAVDLLMADPVVSYGGKDAVMLLIPGDQAKFEFALQETGRNAGRTMRPVFKAQYIEVQQIVTIPEWRPLENWVNFLIAFEWREVKELVTASSESVTVPQIPP
jgi:hypothetical protein